MDMTDDPLAQFSPENVAPEGIPAAPTIAVALAGVTSAPVGTTAFFVAAAAAASARSLRGKSTSAAEVRTAVLETSRVAPKAGAALACACTVVEV